MTDQRKKQNEYLRWGILLGAAMSREAFIAEMFDTVQAVDAPADDLKALACAIQESDVKRVRGLIGQLTGLELGEGETATQNVLRRVKGDAQKRDFKRLQSHVANCMSIDDLREFMNRYEAKWNSK